MTTNERFDVLTFASKLVEKQGLKKAVLVVLVLGVAISLVRYTFPPVFEALGDILSFEMRNAHAAHGEVTLFFPRKREPKGSAPER